MLTITELMTPDPITIQDSGNLYHAKQLMIEHKIRHIPVVNPEEEFVGLISQRDILSHSVSSLAVMSKTELQEIEQNIPIKEIMITDVYIAQVDETDIMDALQHLYTYKHGCLPVLEDKKLAGIVTDNDFLGLSIELLKKLNAESKS